MPNQEIHHGAGGVRGNERHQIPGESHAAQLAPRVGGCVPNPARLVRSAQFNPGGEEWALYVPGQAEPADPV
jgi:hypothetical protein